MVRKNLFVLLFFASIIIALPIAQAQDKEKHYILEEIVVTATRTETPYKEVASSVTIITGEELESRKRTLLLDFLRTVSALDIVQLGGPGKATSVFIRGANPEHTLVLIDGVEAYDTSSPSRAFDFSTLTVDNIARIEILRGPQSTLYGSDAIGGVINIKTKKGSGKPAFFWSNEGGSFKSFKSTAGLTGGNEKIDYSLTASRFVTDGISALKDNGTAIENDGYKNTSLSARIGIAAGENSQIEVISRFQDIISEIDNSIGDRYDDPNFVQDSQQLFVRTQAYFFVLNNRWKHETGVSYSNLTRKNTDDFDVNHPSDLSQGKFSGSTLKFNWQNNIYLSVNNTLISGIETEEEKASSKLNGQSVYGPYTSIFEEKSVRTTGFYLQDQIKTGSGFNASAGFRIDNHSKFGTHTTFRIAPLFFVEKTGTKIKATYGTGFKSPSLFQLYASFFGNENLDPEESSGWDAGVEQYFRNGKTGLGVTYFHNLFESLIGFEATYININKAVSEGIELFVEVQRVKGFSFNTQYTYTKTKDKSTGSPLLRRPKHKFGFNILYKPSENITANLEIISTGKKDDIIFLPDFTQKRTVLDKYELVNIALSYNVNDNIQLFARVDNLFDKEYEEVFGYGTYGIATFAGLKLRN